VLCSARRGLKPEADDGPHAPFQFRYARHPDLEAGMLTSYAIRDGRLVRSGADEAPAKPEESIWLDLLSPTPEEVAAVEAVLGVELPTHEEMQEIELSSRLYQEGETLFLTATVLSRSDTGLPESGVVTFVVTGERLVTLRYVEPRPFETFALRATRQAGPYVRAEALLAGLMDAIVDRVADILEHAGQDLDAISREVFSAATAKRRGSLDFQGVLTRIGRIGDLTSKTRESLVSIGRLLTFVYQTPQGKSGKQLRARFKTLTRDANALAEHAGFLSGKINFLLDATLGLVNIEQSAIIKIFSVVAFVFLPPTLIASIYGMNFEVMPELSWTFGYPLALGLMVLSSILPYLFFKHRGWL